MTVTVAARKACDPLIVPTPTTTPAPTPTPTPAPTPTPTHTHAYNTRNRTHINTHTRIHTHKANVCLYDHKHSRTPDRREGAEDRLHTVTFIQHTVTFIQHTVTFIQHTVTFIQHTVTFILHTVTFILRISPIFAVCICVCVCMDGERSVTQRIQRNCLSPTCTPHTRYTGCCTPAVVAGVVAEVPCVLTHMPFLVLSASGCM